MAAMISPISLRPHFTVKIQLDGYSFNICFTLRQPPMAVADTASESGGTILHVFTNILNKCQCHFSQRIDIGGPSFYL